MYIYYIYVLYYYIIYIYSDKYFDMSSDFSPDIYSDMYGSLAYILTYSDFLPGIWSDISDIDPSKLHVTQTPTCILTYIPAFCSGKLHDMYIFIYIWYIHI
jgi:hypothetical protein